MHAAVVRGGRGGAERRPLPHERHRGLRYLRWTGPVLLVVEIVLVLTGRLGVGVAAAVFLVFEGVLALAAAGQLLGAAHSYRRGRAAGLGTEEAVLAAVQAALPAPVAFVVGHEVRMLSSLVLLLRGRRNGVPPGAVALPYDRALRPMAWLLLGVSVVELVVVELVVPWPAARLVLLLLGLWSLLFVAGMAAAWVVRPHVLTPEVLRLRSGTWADVRARSV